MVAGSARGRSLVAPAGRGTRPTSDRVREAVFNALGSRGLPDGATALDLFAGTGALGIEALSRGADAVVFVEHDRAALSALRANLASTGVGDRATVVATRAEVWLQSDECHRAHFDVVFCDPPYAFGEWDELLAGVSADLVVAESDRPLDIAGFDVVRQRRYGTTFVTFAEPSSARPDHVPPGEAGE